MRAWLALATLILSACSPEPPPTIVIYAPPDAEANLRQRLSGGDFAVDIVSGDAAKLTDSIIARQDSPGADVLVTRSVIDIWRAADQGALRPLAATVIERALPQHRDPDGAWVALGHEAALIGVMPGAPGAQISTYADLGSAELAGHLCLTGIDQPRNRVLISMLIEDLGLKSAERAVRLWIRNLAAPPYADEAELAAALRSGICRVAVVSAIPQVEGLVRFAPDPVYGDIRGIGVTRHAAHPEEAMRLVAWLLATAPELEPTDSNGHHVGVAGWRDEEARLLAERAGYR